MTEIGVDVIGKIEHRRAARQLNHLALGREAESRPIELVDILLFERIHKTGRVILGGAQALDRILQGLQILLVVAAERR